MKIKRLYALFVARNMEFFRDRAALAWNVAMPILLVIGFAFVFSGGEKNVYKVGIYGGKTVEQQTGGNFRQLQHIQFISVDKLKPAIVKVERHQLDMLLDTSTQKFWVNENSTNGYFLEKLLNAQNISKRWQKQSVSGAQLRYIDWVIPGILAMNMMFSSLYGVGYVIVHYRKNGVLKRLSATPLSALEFLLAQLISRLWIVIAVNTVVYFALDIILDFRMYGNYFMLLLIFVLAACSLISLGLIIAARISTEEAAEGILNMISWPMMFLSGVWFSLEGALPAVHWLAGIFPLTHALNAARAVMLDGAGLLQIAPQLLTLAGMTAAFLLLGSILFRWERS